ncbi:HAD family hydrolase [Oceanobacillus piezotolerans]|uniref:HAD family hydrolase n=1 Tax=Oceanobacillus piezotolerans TaxID=2448030 RepID=A0A498DRX4_9BACI|nr:HAD family hydrolase [Oceanobacillus piezotolerans]RLL47737.1 HAD family hydrolase [Oceanobacillus piezotolerans]
MDVRAIFIDMDGTLLTSSNEISLRNAQAINNAMNQGIKVFLATGRHYDITVPYHRALGLQTPMVCLNGAAIHDGRTGKAVQLNPVLINEERFHQLTDKISCNVIIHTSNGIYCKEMNEEIERWIVEGNVAPRYVGNLKQATYENVLKYSIHTGNSCPQFSRIFQDEADVIDWDDGFEIMAQGISKWYAIKSLLRAYGIHPSEAVTFGDGPNDIQMLQNAGTGVAMGNAAPHVKAMADFITDHHEEDGLAQFIERHLIKSVAI